MKGFERRHLDAVEQMLGASGAFEQERVNRKWFLQGGGHGLSGLEVSTDLVLPHGLLPSSRRPHLCQLPLALLSGQGALAADAF